MASGGKKKSKTKGKTLGLNEFLQNSDGSMPSPAPAPTSSSSWAMEMENADFDDGDEARPMFDRSKLPTAPKAARGPDVDWEKIPDRPPYTAFVGNLPYDASEEKIADFFEGKNLEVVNVRLPNENGRQRGFGYVEFGSKEALVAALTFNEESFNGRKLRVDLAESSGGDRDRGDNRGDRSDWRGGGGDPDRTEGDWRRRDPPSFSDDRGGYNDRGGDRYGDRDRGYSDRGGDRYGGNRDRDRDRGFGGGFSDRGGDRYGDRDGYRERRGYGDRGGDRYGDRDGGFRDRGGGRYGDRDSRGFSDRSGGGRYGDRDRYNGDGGGYGRDSDRRYDDRRGGYDDWRGGSRYDDRRGGDRYGGRSGDDRGYGGRSGDGYGRDDGGRYGGGYRDERSDRGGSRDGSQEAPRERPRLNLQPRTKPVEKGPTEPSRSSSIFGSAKPVDTAAKEREIEEKMKKLDTGAHYISEEKENLPRDSYREGGRPRRDSDRSDGGRSGGGRERRLSSSGKGGSSRRDSETSRTSDDSHPPEKEAKGPPREERKMVPAPPPKENAWSRPRSEGIGRGPEPVRQTSTSSTGSQEGYDQQSARRDNRRSSDEGRRGGYGQGYNSGRQDGRRGERHEESTSHRRKDKQLPKSIEDMPKLDQGPGKDWADANKFAAIMDDEDNGNMSGEN